MASVFARSAYRRVPLNSSFYKASTVAWRAQARTRAIHSSPVVLKKKRAAAQEDVFDDMDQAEETDLFADAAADQSASPTSGSSSSSSAPLDASNQKTKKQHLLLLAKHKDSRRTQKFNELYSFAEARVQKQGQVKTSQVKLSSWVRLVELSNTEEEVKNAMDLFGKWREGSGGIHESLAVSLAKRCEELNCPDFALEVFGNYAKYQLPLTLNAGRQLLHSYHTTPTTVVPGSETAETMKKPQPDLTKLLAVSSLYSVYDLVPASQDLVSCSLIASACMLSSPTATAKSVETAEGAEPGKATKQDDALVLGDQMLKYLRKRIWSVQQLHARRAEAAKKLASSTTTTTSSTSETGATDKSQPVRTTKSVLEDYQGMKWARWALANIQGVMQKRFGPESKEVVWSTQARGVLAASGPVA